MDNNTSSPILPPRPQISPISRTNSSATMDTSPSPSTPSSPTLSTASSSPFPRVPDHIVVTFEGQVREMLRITRDVEEEEEERRSRSNSRSRTRPRYYARFRGVAVRCRVSTELCGGEERKPESGLWNMHMMSAMGTFLFPEKKTMIFFTGVCFWGFSWYRRLFVHYYVEHQKRQLGVCKWKKTFHSCQCLAWLIS